MNFTDDHPDAVLAVAACKGDHAAFAVIMRRHKDWLYRFIRRYVADGDDAYDALQECFVSAWTALSRYDPDRPLEAWLRRIALNKCRDRARRNAVRNAALQALRATGLDFGGASIETPDTEPASQRALQRLELAVSGLPRALKEPLVLTMLEELSHREAGELLGISAKAVETRVYRAKKLLAKKLHPSDLSDLIQDR